MNNLVIDELLEMSRRMNERLKQLQRNQSEVVDRLSRKVADHNEVLRGVGEVVGRRPAAAPEADLKAA